MYKIKITIAESDRAFNRQLPNGDFYWKNCHYFINDDACKEADFWVVCYQRLPGKQETCKVAPQNTIFVTWEPDSVWHFSHGFLKQFGKVISCQKHLTHKNMVQDQPGLAWHIGMIRKNGINVYNKTYNDFIEASPEKTKLLSVISSNKAFTKGHRERMQFVQKLKEHFGEQMDVFGRGIKDFDDKWDVIAPYKYHICIENCSQPYYWSEKLADSFLGNAFPFYYGCSNLADFFDEESYRIIDLHKPEAAILLIENCIRNNIAEKYRDKVLQSKLKVLNEYNFFELIRKHIATMDSNAPKHLVTIKDDLAFWDPYKGIMIGKRIVSDFMFKLNK